MSRLRNYRGFVFDEMNRRRSALFYRLRHPGDSDEAKASLALFIAAAASLGLVFITDRADMTSAILVLCGFACFIAGLFILTFHRGGAFPPDICGRLDPGPRIALARIAADIGVDGDAVILKIAGGDPVQFNPAGASPTPDTFTGSTLVVHEGAVGLSLPPLAVPLWRHLRDQYGLITPDGIESSLSAFREVLVVSLELADAVATSIEGEDLVIAISGYRLFDGCRIMQNESPKVCTMFPCAVCGLIGLITADATGTAWVYDRIVLSEEDRSVTITLRRLPG